MRIAILGTRGIPANYGGFETFAEELSIRLVERGHEVSVYCRERHDFTEFHGVRLIYLSTIRRKYFDTLAHTFLSTLHLEENSTEADLSNTDLNTYSDRIDRLMWGRITANTEVTFNTIIPQPDVLSNEDDPDAELAEIRKVTKAITDAGGVRPVGWTSPGSAGSAPRTPAGCATPVVVVCIVISDT